MGKFQSVHCAAAKSSSTAVLSDVTGFDILDNGIGFTNEHRDSFDTLYTDRRIAEGGKGFGRFTCLKYFEDLRVKSVYKEGSGFKFRSFSMGKSHDIIIGEKITVSEHRDTSTVVSLTGLTNGPDLREETFYRCEKPCRTPSPIFHHAQLCMSGDCTVRA